MSEVKYSPNSNRLKGFDYSNSGGYFLTICTKNRENYFGEIIGGKMILNEIGKIVEEEILNIGEYRNNVELDKFVVMPNHVHLIVLVYNENNNDNCRDVPLEHLNKKDVSTNIENIDGRDAIYRVYDRQGGIKNNNVMLNKNSIGYIVRQFKSKCSYLINKDTMNRVSTNNNEFPFSWQPNYYDRVIRNEIELNKIRQYILDNPLKRDIDKNNTENLFM